LEDGRFNGTMQNVVGPILVAMVTKFWLGAEIQSPTDLCYLLTYLLTSRKQALVQSDMPPEFHTKDVLSDWTIPYLSQEIKFISDVAWWQSHGQKLNPKKRMKAWPTKAPNMTGSNQNQIYYKQKDQMVTKAQYTPPTPTRRNCRVESRRRCVLGITLPQVDGVERYTFEPSQAVPTLLHCNI